MINGCLTSKAAEQIVGASGGSVFRIMTGPVDAFVENAPPRQPPLAV
jgi:hypothetical protein